MPIFEYVCGKCGKKFEHLTLDRDAAKPPCPDCGSDDTAKQFSSFAAGVTVSGTTPPPCGDAGPSCGSGCCGGCGI